MKWRSRQKSIETIGESRSFLLLKITYKDDSYIYEVLKRDLIHEDLFIGSNCIGTFEHCLELIEKAGEHIIL